MNNPNPNTDFSSRNQHLKYWSCQQKSLNSPYQTPIPDPNVTQIQRTNAVNDYVISSMIELEKEAEAERTNHSFAVREQIKADQKIRIAIEKSRLKGNYEHFYEDDNGFCLDVRSYAGCILKKMVLFHVKIVWATQLQATDGSPIGKLFRVINRRDYQEDCFFIPEEEIIYPAIKKCQFRLYLCPLPKYENMAWKLLEKYLREYKYETIICPNAPGWHKYGNSYEFWFNRNDHSITSLLPHIKLAHLPYTPDKHDNIISFLLSRFKSDLPDKLMVLLLYRCFFVLQGITAEPISIPKLILIGKEAHTIAKNLLNPLSGLPNFYNVDTESKSSIFKKIRDIRNVPIICYSNHFETQSSQNRFRDIASYATENVENESLPLVLCVSHISQMLEICGIVIETDGLEYKEHIKLFHYFQQLIISEIESSGDYYPKFLNGNQITKNVSLTKTAVFSMIADLIAKIFEHKGIESFEKFKGSLEYIRKQSENPISNLLTDVFRSSTISAVEEKLLLVVARERAPLEGASATGRIYFDEDFYFFTKKTFNIICDHGNIADNAKLRVKQDLCESRFLKTYHASFSHPEYNTDFFIEYSAGTEQKSGLAIRRQFFDEEFGITLEERGQINAKNAL